MTTNLHLMVADPARASRVHKQTLSLIRSDLVENIVIVSLSADRQTEEYSIDERRRVIKFGLWTRSLPRNFVFQIIKYAEYAARIASFTFRLRPEVINVHKLSLLPIGVLLKIATKCALVYDAHELETETSGLRGIRKKLAKSLESRLVGYSDLTIVVSKSIEAWYKAAYGVTKITTVMNAPRFQSVTRSGALRQKLQIPAEKILLLYQGGFSPGRGIERLLGLAGDPRMSNVAFVFLGFGVLEQKVTAASEALENVYFHPAVPPDELLYLTASADIGLVPTSQGSLNHDYSMPNKLFEYVMAGVPVIVSSLPEMERFVVDQGAGVSVEDWTSDALLAAIALLSGDRGTAVRKSLPAVAEANSWEVQEEKMLAAYKATLSPLFLGSAR